jgi:hypothetical protein
VQNYNSIHLTGLLYGVNTNHGNVGNYIESLWIVYHVVIRNTIKVVACYCIDASLRLGRTCILKSEMRGSATGAVHICLFYIYIPKMQLSSITHGNRSTVLTELVSLTRTLFMFILLV